MKGNDCTCHVFMNDLTQDFPGPIELTRELRPNGHKRVWLWCPKCGAVGWSEYHPETYEGDGGLINWTSPSGDIVSNS